MLLSMNVADWLTCVQAQVIPIFFVEADTITYSHPMQADNRFSSPLSGRQIRWTLRLGVEKGETLR